MTAVEAPMRKKKQYVTVSMHLQDRDLQVIEKLMGESGLPKTLAARGFLRLGMKHFRTTKKGLIELTKLAQEK